MLQKIAVLLVLYGIDLQHLNAQFPVETNRETGKKGVVNPLNGEEFIPFEYEDIHVTPGDSTYIVKKDGKFGVVDQHNRLLIPFQFGMISFVRGYNDQPYQFAQVYNELNKKNKRGLINRKGEPVLPMEYEEVRVVDTGLVYGKRWRDTLLYFFDGTGKPLYKVAGRSASISFDKNTIEINLGRSKDRFLNVRRSDGKPYFDGRYPNLVFTNGNLVVYGQEGKYGVVTLQGDTILSFTYPKIKPFKDGNLLITTTDGMEALMNSMGEIIVPASFQKIQKWSDIPDAVYLVQPRGKAVVSIYDVKGKLLLTNCRVFSGTDWRNKNESNQWDYLKVGVDNNTKLGFFRADGKVILPAEFSDVQFFAPKHPILVRRETPDGPHKSLMEAYDLEGKKLMSGQYLTLRYTFNPFVLIGQDAATEKLGLVRRAFLEETRFIYSQINPLHTGYYAAKLDRGEWQLLDKQFHKIPWKTKPFDNILEPVRQQFDQFRKQKLPGNLVAVGYRMGAATQFALNEYGLVFEFEPMYELNAQDVKVTELVERETETIAEAVEMVIEAPAPKVFESVEQMPQFPGGEAALKEFINANLKYPALAREYHIEGRVYISFIVNEFGNLENPQLVRDLGAGCGKEALRLVGLMPKWNPGRQGGKPVSVKFTLPVEFRLN